MRGTIYVGVVLLMLGCGETSSGGPASGGAAGGGATGGGAGAGASAGSGATAGASGVGGAAGSAGGAGGGAAGAGGSGGVPPCALTDSGPITVSQDGQVIEKLRVTSTSGPAIALSGHADVVIRDVEILHDGGPGIEFNNATNLLIERVHVQHTGAPATGPNSSDGRVNIVGYGTTGLVIRHVKLERGSSGIYLIQSPGAKLSYIEGHDFRGPFPRGQLVQFDKSPDGLLEDFSCINPPASSWPEDNVSVYRSSNVTVRRGLLSGNNSPTGVGVMFELSDGTSSGGLAEDVDTVDQGNGSFSGYPAKDVVFRRTRARDNHCAGQAGRPAPSSNSLVWAGSPDSSNLTLEDSRYFNLCNPGNTVWDKSVFSKVEISEEDFTPRAPIVEKFCWE